LLVGVEIFDDIDKQNRLTVSAERASTQPYIISTTPFACIVLLYVVSSDRTDDHHVLSLLCRPRTAPWILPGLTAFAGQDIQ